ncbi:MAG: tRNA (N(6)-L-threonylcarbamoyladenosine(37)-C(2))-methylthiotransferase MtaB [Chloroflexi bacterium]|nr:tRNA (N(6)-L-threonylcarbamoyladenosine(37)-C(2))-methylthiotransferase MtaB [Chloroflexota bacterium]
MNPFKPNHRKPSVALTTLGCKLNQAETDDLARGFADLGFDLVDFDAPADAYVINTCTVTHVADRKSRQFIRQARNHNRQAWVVATGCYVNTSSEEVARTCGVDMLVANSDKAMLPQHVADALGVGRELPGGALEHLDPWGRTRALVKVQDGCNQFCSYCIVPTARGSERSVAPGEVLDEVRRKIAAAHKEIVLTGVHLGAYGRDLASPPGQSLCRLVAAILSQTDVPRLRLSSLEPQDFDPNLLAVWRDRRLCRHVHLPLQSGCNSVLRRMRRRYTVEHFRHVVRQLRDAVRGIAVTTDVIVGFPGETEAEFQETYRLVKDMGFAGIHVFKYSPRRGTPAAALPDQVPYDDKKGRSDALARLANESARAFRETFVGQTVDVLFETSLADNRAAGEGSMTWEGLTDNYLRVLAESQEPLANELLLVHVEEHRDGQLIGRLTSQARTSI